MLGATFAVPGVTGGGVWRFDALLELGSYGRLTKTEILFKSPSTIILKAFR